MTPESPMLSMDAGNTPNPSASSPHDSQQGTAPCKKPRPSLLTILNWFVLAAIIAVIIFSGKYLIHLANGLNQSNQHLASSLYAAEKKLAVQNQQLQNFQQQLRIFQNQNQMRTAWFLSQAEYLTKLASFVLVFQNDVITARKILLAADLQLQSLNNPQIWTVRKTLAQDIATLSAISPVDVSGIVTRINVMSQQIEQLPRTPALTISAEALKPHSKSQDPGFLGQVKNFSYAVSENLKGLFEIQFDAPSSAPLLPPDQFLQIVNNIQFQLTMAQWAVLHQQPAIYQQSLQRALSWIGRYYSSSDNTVKSILSNLQELQQINIKPALPDLSRSLTTLQTALSKAEGPNL